MAIIIPIHKAYGDSLIQNFPNQRDSNKPKMSLFVKHFHKMGYYPAYTAIIGERVKKFKLGKTFQQVVGILTRMGY